MLRHAIVWAATSIVCVMPFVASADWAEITSVQLVDAATQSVIRHQWSSPATDSTTFDASSCGGGVEARFDPSIVDTSTDASAEVRACRSSSDTWQRCRSVMTFRGQFDGTTWYPVNAITQGEDYLLAHAMTATTGGDTARLELRCTTEKGLVENQGGDIRQDSDGDGLFEVATLWDADGDGSVEETCTAKDTPDPACKVAGEIIYRDWADDLNCAMHGCGFGQMENDGTIYHKSGVVYVNWPCWDAGEPAGFNDPLASSEALHDSTSDAAWGHCPEAPNFATNGRRLYTVSTMGWQGEIVGAGTDTRNPETTSGYKRDLGSYIMDDRGPSWNSGANANLNTWFGQNSFIRGITFGYQSSGAALPVGTGAPTGETDGDGDSKGGSAISGDQVLTSIDGDICVTENGAFPTNLVAGDIIIVRGTSQTSTYTSQVIVTALRVRATPDGVDCNGANTTDIEVGGIVGSTSLDYATNPPLVSRLPTGWAVVNPRSDYLTASAKISGFTVGPQDWYNETSGDCVATGTWSSSGDGGQADFDCDTQPLFGLYGGGSSVISDIVIRNWHNHAIDGDSNPGSPLIQRVKYFRGMGGTIMDPGFTWRANDVEVRDSQFETDMMAQFGPGFQMKNLRIWNSSFQQITSFANLTGIAVQNMYDDVQVYSSSFGRLFNFTCGARQIVVRNVRVSGHFKHGPSQTNGHIARFSCADTTQPIEMNTIDNVVYDGIGISDGAATANTSALIVLDFDDTNTSSGANASAIRSNTFQNFRYLNPENTAGTEICLFGVQDDEATGTREDGTPDYSQEDVFTLNAFYGNSIRSTGGVTDFVYCNCGLWDGVDNASANECDKAIKGSGGAGADPRGCLNFDNGAKPANEVCS